EILVGEQISVVAQAHERLRGSYQVPAIKAECYALDDRDDAHVEEERQHRCKRDVTEEQDLPIAAKLAPARGEEIRSGDRYALRRHGMAPWLAIDDGKRATRLHLGTCDRSLLPSPPGLTRGSTWMAGTSPAMTAE